MRRCRTRRRVGIALAGIAIGMMGCRSNQRPTATALPSVRLEASAVTGSPLDASPTTMPATTPSMWPSTRPAELSAVVGVDVTWAVITRVPDTLDPLDAHATLVTAPLAGGPVLTVGRQTAAARFGEGKAADAMVKRLLARTDGPVAQIGHQAGVLVPGSTTTFRLAADRDAANAGPAAAGRSVTISLYTPADAAWVPTEAEYDASLRQAVKDFFSKSAVLVDSATGPATTQSATEPAQSATTTTATRPASVAAGVNPRENADSSTGEENAARVDTRGQTTEPVDAATQPADAATLPVIPPKAVPSARPLGSMTVTLQGFRDTPLTTDDDAPATRPSITATPETAYLDGLTFTPGRRYALVFPCRLGTTPWRGIVALIDVVTPPDDTQQIAEAQFGRPSATQPVTQPAAARTLMRAIDALRTTADPRPPLLFLTTATRASIAADAILVADKPTLDRLRSELLQYTKDNAGNNGKADAISADAAIDPAALGWHLDRSATLALCDAQQAGTLPLELAAVLVVHGGEVGRHADAMADAVKSVGSAADLKARLIGENTIALEDNSPAARVRAFDWLKGQGRAPEGYDPLADAHARRAAINRAISTTQGTR